MDIVKNSSSIISPFIISALLLFITGCSLVPCNDHGAIISELQNSVPFKIVLPKYYPNGIKPCLSVAAPPHRGLREDTITFSILYAERGTNNFIHIEEENITTIMHLIYPSSVFLNFNGVSVLEEDYSMRLAINEPISKGLHYAWNLDGIRFSIISFGYGRSETRKVVKSMLGVPMD